MHLNSQGKRWGSCDDLSLLDAEGAELLLIGARHEPPKGETALSMTEAQICCLCNV